MMGNGWSLQAGTSHFFGQSFSKAFDITFLDENNTLQHCWTTSWGVSTRMEGAVIMAHGDDQGLILPPRIAPTQVIVVPIWRNDEQKSAVLEAVERIQGQLSGIRFKVDDREGMSPGWKFNEWELKGVPVRIEIGPKDVQKGQVVLARRDRPGREGKTFVPAEGLHDRVSDLLDTVQQALYDRALAFRLENTVEASTYDEVREAVNGKFVYAYWCGDPADEVKLKEDTSATTRCLPIDQEGIEPGPCAICGKPATAKAIFGRAY
jgi:prolyl-tRNA synthetase